MSYSNYESAYTKIIPWAVLLAFLILAGLAVNDCRGQTFEADALAGVELWANSQHSYRNAFNLGGEAQMKWGPVVATGYAGVRWWGSANGIAAGVPTNAETQKVLERFRGLHVMLHYKDVAIGPHVHRRMVDHIWFAQKDWRHDYFPHKGGWRGAERRCAKGPDAEKTKSHAEGTCPSTGYWDAYGPRVSYNPDWGKIALSAPIVQWKDLTLTPSNLLLEATIRPMEGWEVEVWGEADMNWVIAADVTVQRRIASNLWGGIKAGRQHAPDWQHEIDFASIIFTIR